MPGPLLAIAAALLALAGTFAAAQAPRALPISAQLYTVRNVGGLDEQLATVAAAGIKYVEPFRFAGMKEVPAAEFKALLDKHGLKVSGMHVNIGALIEETDRIAEYNTAIGNTRLIVPALPASITPKDKAGWQAIGRLFATLAATFKSKGMQVGFHNHAVEMEVFDGKTGYEWFAEAAGPDVIFTLDVAWAARGKQDPAALLGRMKGRVWNIHAKDNAPEGTATDERGFSILGKGTVDWNAVLPAAKDAGVLFYTLEHDMPKDAALVLKEGNAYLSARLEKLLAP
jgi:sugar phosphate isomerase/epimerase